MIYLILFPILSLVIWVVPPIVIKAVYKRRHQSLNEAIKRRDLAIRAIIKNPDEYASIGQVERVTDMIGELKEQITQEDSVLLEISAKLEQTQRYVEEQERNGAGRAEEQNQMDNAEQSGVVNLAVAGDAGPVQSSGENEAELKTPPQSPSADLVRLNKDQREALKRLHDEIESLVSAFVDLDSRKSPKSEADKAQLEHLRGTLTASRDLLGKVRECAK